MCFGALLSRKKMLLAKYLYMAEAGMPSTCSIDRQGGAYSMQATGKTIILQVNFLMLPVEGNRCIAGQVGPSCGVGLPLEVCLEIP